MLPGKPYGGADDTRGALAELVTADGGAGRVLACSLYAPAGPVADLIYVHAKLAVIDDRVLIVGSANLNDHSMFNDTEAALVTDDAELAAIRAADCGPNTSNAHVMRSRATPRRSSTNAGGHAPSSSTSCVARVCP